MKQNKINSYLYIKWRLCVVLQLNIRACDNNTPQKCDQATGQVRMIRQHFPPVFVEQPYSTTLTELRDAGASIFRVINQQSIITNLME